MTLHKKSNGIINLINQTNKTITNQNIIKPTQLILITISGGQDSLCLFFILLQLKRQWKWHFGIFYSNHFWQIDSFYTNSLVFKLGFLFLIPGYLSLPSDNIFSEQKSRTWRYRQFKRLNHFYNYDIIVTGHTATDRIETILLNLIRGTSTRGLSTLNWIRDLSRSDKETKRSSSWEVKSMFSRRDPRSRPRFRLAETSGGRNLTPTELMSWSKQADPLSQQPEVVQLALLGFRTEKLLNFTSNCVTSSRGSRSLRFPRSGNVVAILDHASKCLSKVCTKPSSKFPPGGENLVCTLYKPWLPGRETKRPTTLVPWKTSFYKLGIPPLRFPQGGNVVAIFNRASKTSSLFESNDSLLYDELLLSIEFCSQFFLQYQLSFSKSSFFYEKKNLSFRGAIEDRNNVSASREPLQKKAKQNSFYLLTKSIDRRLISKQSLLDNKRRRFISCSYTTVNKQSLLTLPFRGAASLGVLSTSFIRCAPVILSSSMTFRKKLASHQANILKEKTKFFFSLHWDHRAKATVKSKSKYYAISNKYKCLSFTFNTIILNKKPSKILIKWLKGLYWITLKKKFAELGVFQLKNLTLQEQSQKSNFLGKQAKLVNPIFLELDFIWETTLYVLSKVFPRRGKSGLYFVQTLPLRGEASQKGNQATNVVGALDKTSMRNPQGGSVVAIFDRASRKIVYPLNFRRNQRLIKPYFILSKCQQAEISTIFKKTNWKYIEHFNPILNTDIYEINVNYKSGFFIIYNNNFIKRISKDAQFIIPSKREFGLPKTNNKKYFIIRPLLSITRFDLKKVCALWELPIYPDQTNEKLTYFRNRIRKQLLPLLRFFFNPQIDKLFLQFTEIANTEQLYLDTLSIRLLEEFRIEKINTFELNLSVFNFIPLAIQRRLLKQFIDQYLVKKIKFFHIQILLKLLTRRKINKAKSGNKLSCNDILIRPLNLKIQSSKSQSEASSNKEYCARLNNQRLLTLPFQGEKRTSELILSGSFTSLKKREGKTFFVKNIFMTHNQSKFLLKYCYKKVIQNKNESNIYFVKQSKLSNYNTSSQSSLKLSITHGIKYRRFEARSKIATTDPPCGFLRPYNLYDEQSSSFRKKLEKNPLSSKNKRLCKSQTTCLMDQTLISPQHLKPFTVTKQSKDTKFKLRKKLGFREAGTSLRYKVCTLYKPGSPPPHPERARLTSFAYLPGGTSIAPQNLDKTAKAYNLFASKNKLETPQISLFFGVGAYFIASQRLIVLSIP